MTTQMEGYRVPQWTFGDRLRKIRRDAGLSQVEFAERIGRGEKAVASWELSTNEPRDVVTLAKRIEVAFGVPAGWTLGLAGGPNGGQPTLPKVDSLPFAA